MKNLLHPLFLLCLPLLFASCETEEPEPEPEVAKCKELSQTNSEGYTYKKVYFGENLEKEETYLNGELIDYTMFIHDGGGRIQESHFIDVEKEVYYYAPVEVSYNSDDRWQETREVYSNLTFVAEAEYDKENQITKYTYIKEQDGTDTVYSTVTYDWTGGNNTLRTYTSPTVKTVTEYEFDLSHENMRRSAAEKLAFRSSTVSHNKNMRISRTYSYTDLASGIITTTKAKYDYEYDEAGYPTEVVVTSVTGDAEPVVSTTTFEFFCTE